MDVPAGLLTGADDLGYLLRLSLAGFIAIPHLLSCAARKKIPWFHMEIPERLSRWIGYGMIAENEAMYPL